MVFNILTIVFSGIAIIFTFYSIFIANKKKDRNDITFKMLDRWTSDPLRSHRTLGWQLFKEYISEEEIRENKPIYIGVIREKFQEEYKSLSEVFHFFADLQKLLLNGLINRKLAKELFGSTIKSWFRYVEKIDYQTYEEPESDYNNRLKEFFEDEVFPLSEQLDFTLNRPKINNNIEEKIEEMKIFKKKISKIKNKEAKYKQASNS
ncbi:MAG: hypothetical protein AAF611_04920 [Bacteroidota bacterium]